MMPVQRHREERRCVRVPIELHVTVAAPGSGESTTGIARDISVGGVFIETTCAAAFGTPVVIGFVSPGIGAEVLLPATVRWSSATGLGLQFGLLGARETHAITELMRRHSGVRERVRL
ncbi:MAG TPA: PilZ domain-containing protein [Polyangiaceae bacterium]|jgi:type IV pilus assembly protein PilZ